jgi:hypothetical protein
MDHAMFKRMCRLLPSCCLILTFLGCGSPECTPSPASAPDGTPIGLVEDAAFADAVGAAAEKLEGEAKSQYEAAVAAEPFPRQQELIVGNWHGEFKDGEFESYYEYDRQPSGSLTHLTIDMYGSEKEYLRAERNFFWKTKGRVIYEQDAAEPEMVYLLLLDELSDTSLKYQMIDPEIGYSEISGNTDKRGPGMLPPKPEGWTQVDG